jgi:glucose dehydrogenase
MTHFVLFLIMLGLALPLPGRAQSPDLRKPAGKEWLTIGGDWNNSRYSTLTQLTPANVKDLKGAWVTHLGSGLGSKYSLEATPLVKDGVMYVSSGNDDVFALDARTGALIWEHRSGIPQDIPRSVAAGTIAAWRWATGESISASWTARWSRSTPGRASCSGRP